MTEQSALITLAGALASLLPVLITAVFKWFERRSHHHRRQRALDLAHKRVSFLSDWVKAQENLAAEDEELQSARSTVARELRQLIAAITVSPVTTPQLDQRSRLRRLFLAYWPTSGWAFVLHVTFYALMGLWLLTVIGYTAEGQWGMDPETLQFDAAFLAGELLVFGALALMFCWVWVLARRADRKSREADRYEELGLA